MIDPTLLRLALIRPMLLLGALVFAVLDLG
jgi:hypothetical protein